jgi:hypothetical protein
MACDRKTVAEPEAKSAVALRVSAWSSQSLAGPASTMLRYGFMDQAPSNPSALAVAQAVPEARQRFLRFA